MTKIDELCIRMPNKANERPHEFAVDEEVHEIAAVLDQWYEPAALQTRN